MDLIDRAALFKSMNILFDKEHFQNWSNTAWQIVQDQPTIEAVPLDKLCELLAGNSIIPCEYCQYFSNKHCTVIGDTSKSCPNSADSWQNTLTKWMEGLDATD